MDDIQKSIVTLLQKSAERLREVKLQEERLEKFLNKELFFLILDPSDCLIPIEKRETLLGYRSLL